MSSKFSPFRRRTPLLAILVAAASFWLPAHALAAGPARDDFYGVNPGDLFKLPQSQWDTHLSAIAADGVQVVRMGAWWSDLEPGPPVSGEHNYSFSDIDKQVVALARHGLQWEPLLCFSATWGSKIDGDYNAAPDGNDNFARFGAALARRYGRNGSFWAEHPELPALPVSAYEVWNEENASVYWHPGTPSSYADLYAATRSAIHQVDDASHVVVGGLAAADTGSVQAPADFLRAMYAHRPDLRGTVDAVALHPYGREPQAVYAKVAQFRHDLDAIAGPGVPLELTEIGWTTADTSEQHRADYLGEVASTLARTDCGIDRLTAYAWVGPEQAAGDREQWFGIANRDGSNKPSASAYAASVKTMRGLAGNAPDGTVKLCSGTAGSVPRSVSGQGRTAKAAKLQLKVSVRRHPRRAGRLLVRVRCSTGCLLRVELRAAKLRGKAARASRRRATRVASRRTRRSARSRTLNIRYAKRMGRGSGRIRIKVVATTRGGSRATRYRTVRVHRTHARARARA